MIQLLIALLLVQPEPRWVERIFGPREAVEAAADAEGRPVRGIFDLQVQATGRRPGRVFLNSERDYRDQRNLTISIDGRAASALARRYGTPPDIYFKGRSIRVLGAAQRVRIDFVRQGDGPTGLYYYQTHIRVSDPSQIQLSD